MNKYLDGVRLSEWHQARTLRMVAWGGTALIVSGGAALLARYGSTLALVPAAVAQAVLMAILVLVRQRPPLAPALASIAHRWAYDEGEKVVAECRALLPATEPGWNRARVLCVLMEVAEAARDWTEAIQIGFLIERELGRGGGDPFARVELKSVLWARIAFAMAVLDRPDEAERYLARAGHVMAAWPHVVRARAVLLWQATKYTDLEALLVKECPLLENTLRRDDRELLAAMRAEAAADGLMRAALAARMGERVWGPRPWEKQRWS